MTDQAHRLHLEMITLIGFKSFVDPTPIPLPSNLVTIVGPNGCGKSNIIDAVRWVMGESSVKNLRGESMADVIFNGSSTRKPLGKAAVELVFDNPHGALGGAYAHYAKIAIRREVTRDGQSTYFLNNSRCRRRDIVDIFLGTGLGPGSYAIIGQGTISRLIEAKPAELRVFLEEAAGISKYKERRRETENRIGHTRENLERLNDISSELGKHIQHLQRQAEAAARYKQLKEEERLLRAQLLALRWRVWSVEATGLGERIREGEIQLESAIADLRHQDADIEKEREEHVNRNELLNEVQARYYQCGGEVARLEQALLHQRQRLSELQNDCQGAQRSLQEANTQLVDDTQLLARLDAERVLLNPEVESSKVNLDRARENLQNADQAMGHWQQHWDEFNQQAAQASSQAQVQQTRIRHLEQAQQTIEQRIAKLRQEEVSLQQSLEAEETQHLADQIAAKVIEEESARQALQQAITEVSNNRQELGQARTHLDKARQEFQQLSGRYASLEVLQQAALGQQHQGIMGWLKRHKLGEHSRLAQHLQVESGWEKAIETVLGNYLQAVCVDDFAAVTEAINDLGGLNKGNLTLFATQLSINASQGQGTQSDHYLSSKVTAQKGIGDLLAGILVAEDITQALAKRSQLQPQESIVTRDGLWLGQNWLRVARDSDEKSGVLQREQALQQLQRDIDAQKQQIAQLEAALSAAQSAAELTERNRESCQQKVTEFTRVLADLRAQLRVKEGRQEQMRQRRKQIADDLTEQEKRNGESQVDLEDARNKWQVALAAMEKHAQEREQLQEQKTAYHERVLEARRDVQINRDALHQLTLRQQTLQTELQSKRQHEGRLKQQIEHLEKRVSDLTTAANTSEAPIAQWQVELEQMLSRRLLAEEELTKARQSLQGLEHALREREQARSAVEARAARLRGELEQYKMQLQGLEIRQNTVQEQLEQAEENLSLVLTQLPEDADEAKIEPLLEKTSHRIKQLGAINLAAIDEYASESERKSYLDAQYEDLQSALNTLEEAIRKIDKETRQRFQETYDKVNASFAILFPKIFGGGSAHLSLTDENLLETGVTVMARPPGKRNSTIHLLSGGEKALTAIALVFAIFKLTPAPFCMLDEVDAPLDDANVVRFSQLVKEMSKEVQFIFISHNKIAMEIAQHLAGVTMKEPGVSRMVSVDMEEAMAMAEA